MRKFIITSLLLLLSLVACGQKQKVSVTIKDQDKVNDQNMLDIYKQVKTYNDNPLYEVEFSQEACGYEILINDVPLQRYFLFGSAKEQRIQINDHILKSGQQEITIRLFPPQLFDESWSKTFVEASKFNIKVLRRKADRVLEDYQQIFQFSTSNKRGMENSLAGGQKGFEYKGVFVADVPYQLEGWGNSKDLSKENKDELLKETVAAYNSFRNVLIKKDLTAYASLMYDKEVELAKAYYWYTAKDSKQRWDEISGTVREKREILSLKDFKMVFYANGKVIALQPTSKLYKDYLSAIHAQTENDDIQVSFLLHKKAGTNKLVPVR